MRIAAQKAYVVWWKDLKRWMIPTAAEALELPEGWRFVPLRELLKQVAERVPVEEEGEYKMLGVKWYGEGTFHRETVKGGSLSAAYVTPVVPNAFIYNRLFAWKQSFAVVPPEHGDCFVSNEFPQFIVDEQRLLPRYLYLYLMLPSTTEVVKASSVGSSAVSRNRYKEEEFLNLEIPLPPLPVQQAIVARWRQAQHAEMEAQEHINRKEREIENRFFGDLGIHVPETTNRPKYFAVMWRDLIRWSVRNVTDFKLGLDRLPPARFDSVSLGEVSRVSYGIQKSPANRPGQQARPYLRVANVRKGFLDLAEIKTINVQDVEMESYRLVAGDILFVEGNGSRTELGRVAMWNGEIPDCVHQNHLIKVRLDRQRLLPEYAMTWFNTELGRGHFFRSAKTSSGLGTINSEEVRRAPIPLPPLDVQREIVRRVEEGRAEIARLREEARRRAAEARAELEALILGTKSIDGLG